MDREPYINYVYCPDKDCKLWYDTTIYKPCESCPEKATRMIICFNCRHEIKLSERNHSIQRVECPKCGANHFRCGYTLTERVMV